MRINLPEAEADVVEAALHYVLYSDVISRPHKRAMMARLAGMQQTLDCPPHACGACPRRSTCETRILDIMASSA
ncbi:hypothetical protein [Azospirillum sp. sgz301742]